MPVITLDQARIHLRLASDFPAPLIELYIAGAVDSASQYLNRALFDSAVAKKEALQALPASLVAARAAHAEAVSVAASIPNLGDREDAMRIAAAILADARADLDRTLHGVVVNPSIVSAVLLNLGHLFENREEVVIGSTATDLPSGARALLRPYRRVMMP